MLICLKCVREEQMRKDFIGPEEAEYKKLQRQNEFELDFERSRRLESS